MSVISLVLCRTCTPTSSDLWSLSHRYWDREVQQAAKDLRSPELGKVLVQCFWRPYSLIGAYMFVEVLSRRFRRKWCLQASPGSDGSALISFLRKSSRSSSRCCLGRSSGSSRAMTPPAQRGPTRPTCTLQASRCQPWPSLCFIISISTMSSGLGWRSAWPCATWSIGRWALTEPSCLCHFSAMCWIFMCDVSVSAKALCLNSRAFAQTTTGQIVNLLSNDVNRFDEVTMWHVLFQIHSSGPDRWMDLNIFSLQVTLYLHFLWISPLQAATVIILLLYVIGPSCLAGMSVLFILMPVQTVFGRLFSTLRLVSRLRF